MKNFSLSLNMPKYNFTESVNSIQDGIVHVFKSNKLNISFVEDFDFCGFMFDLELVDIDEAKRQIREFKTYLPYDDTIEYNDSFNYIVNCRLSNHPANEEILNAIHDYFIQ